jgi:hypothetical protein
VVPTPYTLLALTPAEATCFSCLDLKDTFFYIQLTPVNQSIFAFRWEDPQSGGQQQLTWTRPPQGFKNSPTIFGTALTSGLQLYPAEDAGCTLLQYVDDLLLTAANHQDRLKGSSISYGKLYMKYPKRRLRSPKTKSNIWGSTSPKASGTSVQEGNNLSADPNSDYKKTDHEFLGAAGFCQIWRLNFSLLAKPLYKATKGGKRETLIWQSEQP